MFNIPDYAPPADSPCLGIALLFHILTEKLRLPIASMLVRTRCSHP